MGMSNLLLASLIAVVGGAVGGAVSRQLDRCDREIEEDRRKC